jgi:hypothetical protein
MGILQPTAFIQQQTEPTYLGFTTGAYVHLDANKKTSYPGSGSFWYDISGNNRTAAITGSVAFTDGGTGSVSYFYMGGATGSFDEPQNNITVGSTVLLGTPPAITFGGWCKTLITNTMTGSMPTPITNEGFVPLYSYGIDNKGLSNSGLDYAIGIGGNSGTGTPIERSFIIGEFDGSGVAFPRTTDGYFYNYNNKWMHIMMRCFYTGSYTVLGGLQNIQIYVNGTLQAEDGETGGAVGTQKIHIGGFNPGLFAGSGFQNYLAGSFSTVEVYNRYLTPDEIYGNFNVSKSFYGY